MGRRRLGVYETSNKPGKRKPVQPGLDRSSRSSTSETEIALVACIRSLSGRLRLEKEEYPRRLDILCFSRKI